MELIALLSKVDRQLGRLYVVLQKKSKKNR